MKIPRCAILLALAALFFGAGCATTSEVDNTPTAGEQPEVEPTIERHPSRSVLRVSVTSQAYDFFRPWRKQSPSTKIGLGPVISPEHILVTATLVENATVVELEDLESGDQAPAEVECVDYMANLALLRCRDAAFMSDKQPLAIQERPATVGEQVSAWQFEDNGTPFLTDGVVRTIETAAYPYDGRGMLVYRIELSLSRLTSSYVIPVVGDDDRIVGLLMNYSSNTRIMTLVSAPVIEHFLRDLGDGDYQGFPSAGVGFAYLDDPSFREYLGVTGISGVYISRVRPDGPAAAAGIQRGDVLIAIDYHTVDRNGEYDDPHFGKTSLAHLIATRSYAGDVRTFRVIRDGMTEVIDVPLDVLPAAEQPIPPYVNDRAPPYLVLGGFVFTELTGEYLRAWGPKWPSSAPRDLVYAESHQWQLFEPDERAVILGHVLPARGNNGFTEINNERLVRVNGREIHGIEDLAAAIDKGNEEFIHLELDDDPFRLVLHRETVAADNQFVLEHYRLPALQRLGSE